MRIIGTPASLNSGTIFEHTRTASSTVCSLYVPARHMSQRTVSRTMTVGYILTPFGARSIIFFAVSMQLSSVSPGRPVIICKMRSKPAAFMSFEASATAALSCPRPDSSSTLSHIDCAPSSMTVTPYFFSRFSTVPSIASGLVDSLMELIVPSARYGCAASKSSI